MNNGRFKKGQVSPRKGVALSEDTKKKISASKKGQASFAGKKHTQETKDRISKNKLLTAPKGENHANWKGGISRVYKTGYYSREYKDWRAKVFKRDNFTCQGCKGRRGQYITAHHIKGFAKYPKLRYDLDNGITLCEKCHSETDNYKGRANKCH